MQKLLVDHGLGRRPQRVARAAAITTATTGLSTDAAREAEPFGFCHYSTAPGAVVAMDSFYIGHLQGVGKVYQLTAIDVATRWAIMLIVLGPITASHTIRFIDHLLRTFRRVGVDVRAVLSDNGPEYIASGLREPSSSQGGRRPIPASCGHGPSRMPPGTRRPGSTLPVSCPASHAPSPRGRRRGTPRAVLDLRPGPGPRRRDRGRTRRRLLAAPVRPDHQGRTRRTRQRSRTSSSGEDQPERR